MDTGDTIDENAVYLEDLGDDDFIPRPNKSTSASPLKLPQPPPLVQRKYVPKDQYALPLIEGTLESRAKSSDPRIATEEELRDFIEEMRPEDFDIDSEFFGSLPIEVKYEIIGDLRIKSRQVNHRRTDAMRHAPTPLDFSKAQIQNLMQRNTLTQKLFTVTDALGQSEEVAPVRVAGVRNREYILVKQDAEQGGGWVLGVKNPQLNNRNPIIIDSSEDEESDEGTNDSDEFEEVGIPSK
jgi:DNA excision repair protein ERCC-5